MARTKVKQGGIDYTTLINLLSGQIKFPATQAASSDANTFDDYEEGTWTPIDSSGASLTFSGVSANYIKLGRLVIAWFALGYPVTVSGSSAKIGGLPFTPTSAIFFGGFLVFLTLGAYIFQLVTSGVTTFSLYDDRKTKLRWQNRSPRGWADSSSHRHYLRR